MDWLEDSQAGVVRNIDDEVLQEEMLKIDGAYLDANVVESAEALQAENCYGVNGGRISPGLNGFPSESSGASSRRGKCRLESLHSMERSGCQSVRGDLTCSLGCTKARGESSCGSQRSSILKMAY